MNKTILIIIGLTISFIATSLGSFFVLFIKNKISEKLTCIINGFSSGIMISASVWGLLIPSFDYGNYLNNLYFLPAIIGTLLGCAFLILIDILVKNTHKNTNSLQKPHKNNLKTFIIAFTIHNIPEGMAIGFAFGNAVISNASSLFASAMMIAVAISIQNIPEGLAVALPVYKETKSKRKAFLMGTLSGIVEPIFALFGYFMASVAKVIIPWLLAFSAGTLLFVAVDDLIPNSKLSEDKKCGAWAFIFGFIIMMLLDVLLS